MSNPAQGDGKTQGVLTKRITPNAPDEVARIVRDHQKAVFAVAYAKLRNSHDAEDVTQDVFVEAYRNLHKLRNPEHASAWLFKAIKYRCADHVRKMSRREKREATFAEYFPANTSANPQAERERNELIMKAIELLPEKFRLVIMLKHYAQLSYRDISKMTGLSKTTIDGRLRTAKKKLRKRLVEMGIGMD